MALRRLLLFLLVLAFFQVGISDLHGQVAVNPIRVVPTDPTGACPPARVDLSASSGNYFYCDPLTMMWAQLAGGGAVPTIAATTNALVGDGTGNAVAASGIATDCLHVDGSSNACPASANYSQSFTTQTSVALTHNLNTTAVITQCFSADAAPVAVEWDTMTITDANTVTVTFQNNQSGKCVVTGNLASTTNISISTTCGISGGTITSTGTLTGIETVNSQTGTSYAIQDGDCGKLVTLANGSAIAVSIAQAGAGGSFAAGWFADIQNTGAGTVTITPTTSTINGGATLVLLTGQGVRIVSASGNYFIAGSIANGGTVQNITINNSTTNNLRCNKCSLNGTELTNLFPNAASPGTTVNKLAKLTGTGTVVISSAGDTGGVIGICTGNTGTGASNCGTTGSSEIAIQGTFSCVFDNATTADDYVTISPTVAGDCHDFGSTYPIGQQVLGRVLVTAAAGTRSMALFGPEINSYGIKSVQPTVLGPTDVTAVGNGKYYFVVPATLNNYRLTSVLAQVTSAGTTGTTTVALTRCVVASTGDICSSTTAQMLSTNLTVDSGENTSSTAATPAVINTANATVTTGQVIRVDITAVSTTPAVGLMVNMDFTTP